MPIGTAAETLSHVPSQAFVTDPGAFFQMTRKNVVPLAPVASPGAGGFARVQLPQTGIVSKLLITFVGTLTVTTAAATTSDQWPYNLLKSFRLSANGQNDLFSCDGIDLNVLRFLRNPAYVERVDQFTGTVGGGDSVAVAAYPLSLTWEVPIAMDDTSLVGALYAQSGATSLVATIGQALSADLFSANPANAAITGTWYVSEISFEVPYDAQGNLVVPDLSRLHGFNAVDVPVAAVGDQRAALIRSSGQLSRLLISVRGGANTRLSALPSAASTRKLDALRLEYGGNQRPFVFSPASQLLSINNDHYGAPLPYDRLALDFVKENPPRDVILLQGVTELAVVPTIGSGVTIAAATTRVVQETLF
jgi:hypothetical protein